MKLTYFGHSACLGKRGTHQLLPRGDNFTMGVADASRAAEFLNAKRAVPIHYNRFLAVLHLTVLFASVAADAQILPNAPVYDFRMPMFGENGYIVWELRGSEGRFISRERIDVENLSLRFYSGDSDLTVIITVKSPKASIYPDERRATSGSGLHVAGHNFEIVGERWDWVGDEQTLRVREEVRVTFFEKITDILR